ncbi:synaptic vesicle VAT-1 family membrane protein [Leptospira meyeri]|uniref:synaptic vesicle VAT-1 family membrane protein n=1 Tax=Leptospira meyeri TaxID=29508 RepID=UPI000C2ACF39|nr:medium chain dehydrogenase/reductase family protein [Leptospira meyeri]PJZ81595.1 zinc-binding dehydrogenase [Leptospira meyeri]PJZ97097.1 zinc-binding dehydrogenase [Leptospira meyeri]PKA11592.1 zinc-binding dehydrogenase [Leptospira meyeri]
MLREVYRIEKTGSIDNLHRKNEPLRPPEGDEVTIEVKAIGLNFADVFSIYGLYSATPKGSFIPGLEFAGKIVKIGEKVKNFEVGDSVFGVTRFGAYTTHLNISEKTVFALPKDWSMQDGAAFAVQALTAYYALIPLGQVKEGDHVLIHSAAGGVGIMAGHIAKKKKAITIGLVGDSVKFSILKEVGYDYFLIRSPSFKQEMQKILSDHPLKIVLECLGGRYFQDSYDLLAPMGRLVTYGSANFTPSHSYRNWLSIAYSYLRRPKIDPLSMISDNKSVMGFNLIWLWNEIDELRKHFSDLMILSLPKQTIGHEFTFDSIHDALRTFQSGQTIGKIVIKVP